MTPRQFRAACNADIRRMIERDNREVVMEPDAISTTDSIIEVSEKVGYLRAINDVLDELKRVRLGEARAAIALFARAKGLVEFETRT
jgi:hypothetical protein